MTYLASADNREFRQRPETVCREPKKSDNYRCCNTDIPITCGEMIFGNQRKQ